MYEQRISFAQIFAPMVKAATPPRALFALFHLY